MNSPSRFEAHASRRSPAINVHNGQKRVVFTPDLFQADAHHAVFAELRDNDPVHWSFTESGQGFWSLTKHADVRMANRDTETFTVTKGYNFFDPEKDAVRGAGMMEMLPGFDGARHQRFRAIVNRGFTPRVLRLLEEHLAARARVIVDDVIDRGECDFVEDVAAKLPIQTICEMVGIPQSDYQRIFEWSNVMVGLADPDYTDDIEQGIIASVDMLTYALELRKERTTDPHDDIVTKLTQAGDGDNALTEEEFGGFFLLLVLAGNETTRNAIAHGMRALIDHPDQLRALRAQGDPDRIALAVEEILRWSSPVHVFRRTATRDIELRGKTIKEGDWVALWYASANRDSEAFNDPFRFDIERNPNDHVTFGGGGPHFCLGANLARLELRLMFRELVNRMPDLELVAEPAMLRSSVVRGMLSMPVRWKV